MEQHLSWLDELFLAAVLYEDGDNKLEVTIDNFSITPAVPIGNNYLSDVYRVKLQCKIGQTKEKCLSLIIKAPLTKGTLSEMAKKVNFYKKEPKIYNELIPKMIGNIKFEFSPKSFYSPIENVLVLKDMKEEGYVICDTYKQLDYSHCKSVIITLAKFHAASVPCYHDNAELIKAVSEEQVYDKRGLFAEISIKTLPGCLKMTGDILNEMDGGKPLAELLFNKAENISDSVVNICKPKVNGLNVLNHGDLKVDNILFKHSSTNEVVDVKFIDFQFARFASPALDLLYFIWTSANENVREKKQQELYKIYLKTLNETLKQMGCEEEMTAEDLLKDLKLATDFTIAMICQLLPLLMCESKTVDNLKALRDSQNGDRMKKLYNNQYYRAIILNTMKQFKTWFFS